MIVNIKKASRILFFIIAVTLALFIVTGCNSNGAIKIKFEPDNEKTVKSITVKSLAELQEKMPADPKKEGYDFVGWYTDVEKTIEFNPNQFPTEDITLYAGWNVSIVTVTFKSNLPDITRDLNYGNTLTDIPPVPPRVGYLGRWDYEEGALSNIRKDFIIEAEYTLASFSMSFVTDPTEEPEVVSSLMGQPYQKLADPLRENYVFGGWYTDTTYSVPYIFPSVMPAENITLYAWWVRENELADYFVYETANYGGFTNNAIRITGITRVANFQTNMIIPARIEGLDVKYIGYDELQGGVVEDYTVFETEYLTSIRIPRTVEYIGQHAFAGAGQLERVLFEENSSLKKIYGYAFAGCAKIEQITIPASVEELGDYVFSFFGLPEEVTPQLSSVRFEADSGLSSIGRGAFYGAMQLTLFTIPKALTAINYLTFENCGIKNFAVESGHQDFSVIEGVLFSYDGTELMYYPNKGGKDLGMDIHGNNMYYYGIPKTTRKVRESAFRNNDKLTNIMVTNVVNEIQEYAFAGMSRLKSLTFEDNSQLQNIRRYAFADSASIEILRLPASLKNIEEYAFSALDAQFMGVREITLPEGLLTIDKRAFAKSTLLTSLTIPSTVQTIGEGAFYGCNQMSLTINNVGSILTDIGDYAFYKCYGIRTLTLPSSLVKIGSYAFSNDDGATVNMQLLGVTIESNDEGNRHLEEIGEGAFANCIFLEQFNVSERVSAIGERAFYNCKAVRIQFSALNTMLEEIQPYTFYGCSTLSNIVIPRTVTVIGDYAFFGCTYLTTVQAGSATTPSSITNIGNSAFEGCVRLLSNEVSLNQSILFPNTVNVGSRAFAGCAELTNIRIVDTLVTLGEEAFANCTKLTTIRYGGNTQLSVLPKDVFKGCNALQNFRFPNSVTTIEGNPFSSCNALVGFTVEESNENFQTVFSAQQNYNVLYTKTGNKTIVLFPTGIATNFEVPFDVQKIAPYAFSSSKVLRLTFAGGVTGVEIGEYAFAECKALSQVALSTRVNAVGQYAFSNCTLLSSVAINDGSNDNLLSIGSHAFYNTAITAINIPERVNVIGPYAFSGCYRLDQVTFTQSLLASEGLYIDYNAFYECIKISSMVLPARLTHIDDSAFAWCVGLTELIFAEGDTPLTIGSYVFDSCQLLVRVTLPARLTAMGSNIFSDCSYLEYAAIEELDGEVFAPEGVNLGEAAFSGCSELRTVIIPGHIKKIGSYAFYNCTNIRDMIFADSAFDLEIGSYAFSECDSIADFELPSRTTLVGDHAFYRSGLGSPAQKMVKDGSFVAAYRPGLTFASSARPMTFGEYAFAETRLSNILIPERVTEIGAYAFAGNPNLFIINFEADSLCTVIGDGAFENIASAQLASASVTYGKLAGYNAWVELEMLYGVSLPLSLEELGAFAFRNAVNFSNFILNEGLITIGEGAFYGCEKITSIDIPESVQLIGDSAFYNCRALQDVNIMSNTGYTLGSYAFSGCISLTELSLKMVSMIGDAPAYGCDDLALLYVDNENGFYKTIGNVLYSKNVTYLEGGQPKTYGEDELLILYPAGKQGSTYGITRNTKEIGQRAFSGNRYLTSLSIDAKETAVVSIHSNSFENTSDNLEFFVVSTVEFLYEQNIMWRAFTDRIKSSAISVENFIIELLPGDSQSCRIIKYIGLAEAGDNLVIPSTLKGLKVKEIGQNAFSYNATIRTVRIPQGVTALSDSAFYNCVALETIYISDSVQEIGEYAFFGCDSLTNVVFGVNSLLTAISNYSFQNCVSLTYFVMPWRVTSIGMFAFAGAEKTPMKLKSITFSENSVLATINSHAFQYCADLTTITLPQSLTMMSINIFKRCDSLTSVVLSRGTAQNITQLQSESVFADTPVELMIYVPSQAKQEYIKARYWKSYALRIGIKESITDGYSVEDTVYDYQAISIVEYLGIQNPTSGIYDKSFQAQFVAPETFNGLPIVVVNSQAMTFRHRINNAIIDTPYSALTDDAGTQIIIIADGAGRQHSVKVDRLGLAVNGLRILKYLGEATDITVPAVIQAKPVLEIGSYSFSNKVRSIRLAEGILSLNENAFRYATSLKSLIMPLSLIKIGAYSMYDTDIDSVTIGVSEAVMQYSRLREIGDYAFFNCTEITALTVPPQVDRIGHYAFAADSQNGERMSLSNIAFLGQKMTYIGRYAFASTSIETITLPERLVSIGEGAFSGCTYLLSVYLNDSSRTSVIVNLDSGVQNVFENCNHVKIYVDNYKLSYYRDGAASWNSYVSRIFSAQNTFNGFTISIIDNDIKTAELVHYIGAETDVEIPSSINGYRILSIAPYAFSGKVESVIIPNTVASISSNAFYKSGVKIVHFAMGSIITSIGQYAFYGSSLETIAIPMSVTSIGDYAFAATPLINISFDGVDILEIDYLQVPGIVIGGYAFSGNPYLQSITLPRRMLSVGQYAFYNDIALDEINLPADGILTSIYSYAFSGCTSLSSIIIPFSVTEMYTGVFDYCTALESVFIMRGRDGGETEVQNLTTVGPGLLNNINNPFIKIFVPRNSVSEYKNMANWKTYAGFSDNGVFDPLVYPDYIVPNLIYGDYAYSLIDSSSIELTQYRGNAIDIFIPGSITIGLNVYNVKSIGRMFGNKQLRTITMQPGYRQVINIFAFSECISLERVELSQTVETISAYAFYKCAVLRSVVLPEGITSLPASVFQNCSSLRELNIPSTVTAIGAMAFANCGSLYRIHLNTAGIIEGGSNMLFNASPYLRIFAAADYLESYRTKTIWSEFAARIISKSCIYGNFAVEQLYGAGISILQYAGFLSQLYIPEYMQGVKVENIIPNAIISNVEYIYLEAGSEITYGSDIAAKVHVLEEIYD
ncbi:MAG: leucine-rich repeat protein [Clostridia bacterium]|nr:leucine-rich repeat protein [Clostridia bacterium]